MYYNIHNEKCFKLLMILHFLLCKQKQESILIDRVKRKVKVWILIGYVIIVLWIIRAA